MKLADLEPRFLRLVPGEKGQAHHYVHTLEEAQGVMFLCPRCWAMNQGRVGTHYVLAWFRDRGVPEDAVPGPARWGASGTAYHDLSLTPSVLLIGGCAWHGFVTAGEVTTV